MRSLFAHMRYSLTMNARQPGIWLRVLVVVPLMEVLPLLFLGRAYLESDTQNFFLYTNMVWATFNDLGEAFIKEYKYNMFMAPDCDQLRAISQRDKESLEEYAQR